MPMQQSCKASEAATNEPRQPTISSGFLRRQKQGEYGKGIGRRNQEFKGTIGATLGCRGGFLMKTSLCPRAGSA